MPRRKIQRPYNKQKIPGDYRLRFYRDAKSGHPFMSISKNCDYHKSIKRIKNIETHLGRRFRRNKNWTISKADLRILKRLDKKKIKNVRRAND